MTDRICSGFSARQCSCCPANGGGYYMEVGESVPLLRGAGGARHPNQAANTFEKIWLACLLIAFTVGVAVGTYLLWEESTPEHSSEKFIIVARRYWYSQDPPETVPKMSLPVQYVLLTQTKTQRCVDKLTCRDDLNAIQKQDVQVLEQPDIIFNFIVGGEGRMYEGRGWYNSTGRKQFGKDVLVIAFSGTFEELLPNEDQVKSVFAFLDYSIMRNKLDPCFQLLADDSDTSYIHNTLIRIENTISQQNRC